MANPERPSSAWVLDPRATTGFILACVLLVAVNVVGYYFAGRLTQANAAIARSQSTLLQLNRLLDHLLEAETEQRGYLLTGQAAYLEPYRAALQHLESALAQLHQQVADDPAWQDRLARLEPLIKHKRQDMDRAVELRSIDGMDAAIRAIRTGEGKIIMDDIRGVLTAGIDEASRNLDNNTAIAQATSQHLYRGIALANVLALGLVTGAVLLVNRTATRQKEVGASLRHAQEELETRVRQRAVLLTRVNEVLQEEIVEHRRAEERASRLAALVEFSEDAILGLDLEGHITSWNPGAQRLCGYQTEELSDKSLSHLMPADRADDAQALMERVSRGESVPPFETPLVRKDGTSIQVSLSIAPVRAANGQIVGAAAVARDISERHKLEGQLRQAAKMEAVGRLAAGVAHDFNNLLTVILGSCDLLLFTLRGNGLERSLIEEIAKAGDRAAALTRQLLAFSRQQPLAPSVVDLNEVVAGMARMLPRLLGSDIRLAVALAPEPATVFADVAQMEQVLLNLAVNARDAMPGGGKLTIETQRVKLDETATRHQDDVPPGSYVLLAVSDTGCGMTEEVRAHLFEPFFTTKEKGKGTGLGLAMVYGIVKQSGGHIAVHSQVGRGTTIQVFLPPRAVADAVEAAPLPAPPVPGGSETVLLVEDDVSVRALVARILRQHGYRVLEAADGNEAIQAAAGVQELRLLVVDVVLPGLGGREVADRLVAERPSLKVLFLSGYPEHAVLRHGVLEAATNFLQKPFSPDALARKVRAVLNGNTDPIP